MGHWVITIKGHGCHHNKREDDAEVMATKFVEELREAGHLVDGGSFILTGMDYGITPHPDHETSLIPPKNS